MGGFNDGIEAHFHPKNTARMYKAPTEGPNVQ
jgi:hypothetical protein